MTPNVGSRMNFQNSDVAIGVTTIGVKKRVKANRRPGILSFFQNKTPIKIPKRVCKTTAQSKKIKVLETDPANLPNLDLYIDPFENCKVFTSPLSTMNLEASLLGIPSVAIDLKTNIPVSKNCKPK